MSKRQKRQIIDLPVYLSKLHSTWLIVIFYPKSNERVLTLPRGEKPQLERQLAHAQTFDRGVELCRIKRFSLTYTIYEIFTGADGGLDFGVLKVFDESKQSMSLKNKGRYEISYNFVFDTTKNVNIGDLLTIVPQKGVLIPTERPTQVQVVFRSRSEVSFKDETMLKCQVRTFTR